MKKLTVKKLCICAVLIALDVILTRFVAINTPITKIGLGFLPVMLAGMLYGPVTAGILGAVGDVIGALLFPTGAFFPGFTLTALCFGVVWGLFLHRKPNWWKLLIAVCINQLVFSLCLNTFWLTMITGSSFKALLASRAIQFVVVAPAQYIVGFIFLKVVPRLRQYTE